LKIAFWSKSKLHRSTTNDEGQLLNELKASRAASAQVSRRVEKRITVRYKDAVVGEFDADVIVEDCVLVEIKIAPQYDKRDEAQLLNELKATGIKLGLLVNFGRTKVEFKRLVL